MESKSILKRTMSKTMLEDFTCIDLSSIRSATPNVQDSLDFSYHNIERNKNIEKMPSRTNIFSRNNSRNGIDKTIEKIPSRTNLFSRNSSRNCIDKIIEKIPSRTNLFSQNNKAFDKQELVKHTEVTENETEDSPYNRKIQNDQYRLQPKVENPPTSILKKSSNVQLSVSQDTGGTTTASTSATPWEKLRQKLVTAKVREALSSAKLYVNAKQYTIIRVLGEGGYSTVYEVSDQDKAIRKG